MQKKRSRQRSGWYWKGVTPLGCWEEEENNEEWAFCSFQVETAPGVMQPCGHRLKIRGGADGMRNHAESHGLSEVRAKKAQAEKMVSLRDYFPIVPNLTTEQTKVLHEKLALALANDGRPFSLLDKKGVARKDSEQAADEGEPHFGLHEWLQLLHPGYSVPHHNELTKIAREDVVPQIQQGVKDILRKIDFLSFTSDGWKNTSQNINYRDLSCHGIIFNPNGEMCLVSFLLGIKPVAFKDALSVGTWISDILDKYEIPRSKRGVLTADGAEKAAAREAGLEYWWCVAHWINLAVHDAIKETEFIQTELDGVKSLVTAIRQSSMLQASLDAIAGRHITLKQDVETRWSSEFIMLESVLDNLVPLRQFFNLHPDLRINNAGLALLEDIRNLLAVAYDATKYMETQKKITSVDAWKVVWSCISTWRKNTQVSTSTGELFKDSLISAWKKRAHANFSKSDAAKMCFFLNPTLWGSRLAPDGTQRFAAFEFYEANEMHDVPGVHAMSAQSFMRHLQELASQKVVLYGNTLPGAAGKDEPALGTQKASGHKSKLFETIKEFDEGANGAFEQTDPNAQVFFFIKNRTYEPVTTALTYYAAKRKQFPAVVRMATRYLCIPAASVASESLWNLAGYMSEDERAATSPEHLENQLQIRRNSRAVANIKKLLNV